MFSYLFLRSQLYFDVHFALSILGIPAKDYNYFADTKILRSQKS